MNRAAVPSEIYQELSNLVASLEREGFKTRAQDQPKVVRNGEPAKHYSCGSPHPEGYTKHLEWQALRERLFRMRQKKCEHCGRTRIIQVHHRYYFSNCKAWEYEDGDLCLLCKICHSLVHGYVGDARRFLLAEGTGWYVPQYDEEIDDGEEEAHEEGEDVLLALLARGLGDAVDPTMFFDEDNPELWRIEYVEDPEGRSDRLRSDLDDDSDDEDWDP